MEETASTSGPPLQAVTFVDLDPIVRIKRRLLILPGLIEAVWCVSILFTVPFLSFTLAFSTLGIAALSVQFGADPLLIVTMLGASFLIFCSYGLLWILPLGIVAAMRRDEPWALCAAAVLAFAAAATIAVRSAASFDPMSACLCGLATLVALNSIAHLVYVRRGAPDRSTFRLRHRGSSIRPSARAILGAAWDLARGILSIAVVGCIVALALKAAGPFTLIFYILIVLVVRRPVSRRFLAAVESARSRLQGSVDRRFRADVENPILFLRSFSDDVVRTDSFGNRIKSLVFGVELESTRLEESIVEAARKAGPLIAIARPGSKRPTIGAARQRLTDDEWQTVVSRYIDRAACIILVQGKTDGLGWELAEIRRRGRTRNLIMIVPPDKGAGMEDVVRAWSGRPRQAVAKSFIGAAPPLAVIEGSSNDTIEACIGSRLDADAYRLSTRFCLNRILNRDAPSSTG